MPALYALPELVQARLEAAGIEDPASGATVPVLHVADLLAVREEAQRAPALLVAPGNLAVVDQRPGEIGVRESVALVAVVRYPNQRSGQRERQQASDLLRAAILALAGWKPSDRHTELVAEDPPRAARDANFGYYPFQFSSIYQVD